MVEKLVSVIVPVYNVEQYLDQCLESITEQTYKNLEIILVDDGSPDNCPKICDNWKEKDSRIKVIHKENAGLGMARKTGFEAVTGEFVFFFDSDDYVAEDLVERCVFTALKHKADTVAYGRNEVYPDGRIKSSQNIFKEQIYEADAVKNVFLPKLFDYGLGCGVSQWSKMFSVGIIKDNNINFSSERDIISEDSIFSLEYFSNAFKVVLISDKLYYYRKNEKSLTHKFNADRHIRNNEFLVKTLKKIQELGLSSSLNDYVTARYHGMTLGFLMQVLRSDLTETEKKQTLEKVFRDDILRNTLKKSAISHDAFLPRMFWWALRFKCYFLCRLFLKLRASV